MTAKTPRKPLRSIADLPPRPVYATRQVEIESWDATVTVRELAGTECEWYQRVGANPGKPVSLDNLVGFLQAAITDDQGGAPFAGPEGAKRLKSEPYAVLLRLFTAAMDTSSLTPEGVEAAKKG